jgi:phosphoglycolate phosphatase-like HAD superfamily hydrolase
MLFGRCHQQEMHGGLERGLALGGYEGLFEGLIGADDVRNPKPHAEPVLKALESLKVTAERAVFVGDSPHDMACDHAAGVQTGAALRRPLVREALEPLSRELRPKSRQKPPSGSAWPMGPRTS